MYVNKLSDDTTKLKFPSMITNGGIRSFANHYNFKVEKIFRVLGIQKATWQS